MVVLARVRAPALHAGRLGGSWRAVFARPGLHALHAPQRRLHDGRDLARRRAPAGVREERHAHQREGGRHRVRARRARSRPLPAPGREALGRTEPDARLRADGDPVGRVVPRRLGRRRLDARHRRRSGSLPPRCSCSPSASACTARSTPRSASTSRRRSSSAATSPPRASRGRSAGSSAPRPAASSCSTGRSCSGRSPQASTSPAQRARWRSSRACRSRCA